jgi:pre-mRNA-splicing factor SYF1
MLGSNIFTQPHASMDIQFEEEIKRNPYNVKVWWAYAHSKMDQLPVLRFAVYERALSFVPRSYKLWHAYLQDRVNHLSGTIITSRKFDLLIQTFERALVHMNKMPRIWYVSMAFQPLFVSLFVF